MNINRDIVFIKTAKSLYQFNFVNFGGVPYGFEWIWSQNNLDPSFLCQKIGIPVFYFKNFSTCRGLKIPESMDNFRRAITCHHKKLIMADIMYRCMFLMISV